MGNSTMDPRGSTELTVEVLRGDDNIGFCQTLNCYTFMNCFEIWILIF